MQILCLNLNAMIPSIYVGMVTKCNLLWRFFEFFPHEDFLLPDRRRVGGQPELDFVLRRRPASLAFHFLTLLFHFYRAEIFKERPDSNGGN